MQAVILAGGLGTRVQSRIGPIPKSMLLIRGKPFLEYQLSLLRENGIREILLCVGYLSDLLERHFGDGKKFGVKLTYSYEKERLLGTGGALRNALPFLEESFYLLYGDSYLEVSFPDVYHSLERRDCPVLITVYRNEDRWDASNVVFDKGEVKMYDKRKTAPGMDYIDYGLAVFKRAAVEKIPAGVPYDLADLYSRLAREGKLGGREVFERFYEVGSPQGIKDFEDHVTDTGLDLSLRQLRKNI